MAQTNSTKSAVRNPAGPKTSAPPVRERLIASAARLFAEKSFGGVSVRDICKDAGTSINMIHHYFGNKEGLRDAIVAQFDENVYLVPMRLLESPAASREDLAARLLLTFETTLEACLRERDVMMVVIREQAPLATLDAFQAQFVAFLEAAKAEGYVRETLECSLISGAMLDRIIAQAQYAPYIKASSGIDVANDAGYRAAWCRANLDLFLHGMLAD